MAFIVEARNIDALWYKTYKAIRAEGVKVSGIQEIPNLIMVLTGKFAPSKFFDTAFRQCFGDERIDYASSVTFVQPEKGLTGYSYPQNKPNVSWTETYWGRMTSFSGQINQIEAAIKKLSGGKNTKMISIAVYDPVKDSKKVMGGVPCLSSLDIKPRDGKLDITAFFRSMRFSKAGYADIKALCDLGLYLCERTGTEMGSLTLHATSGHIFYSGDEFRNSNALVDLIDAHIQARKQ